MNAEPKRLWLEALRSGKYEQGTDALALVAASEDDEQFCCLGVACEVAIKAGLPVTKVASTGSYFYDGEPLVLPKLVRSWLGVKLGTPLVTGGGRRNALSVFNDEGMSFGGIADLIEAQL